MKNSTAFPSLFLKQNALLLIIAACLLFTKTSKGQTPFTVAWPLTADQSFSASGAGAPNITAVNQVLSTSPQLYIPSSNQYAGTTSGTAGDGQRTGPRLNDGSDGGWINDGGAVEGRYMEFTVSPNAGFSMTVSSIAFSLGNRSRSEIKGNAYYYVAPTNAAFTLGTGTALGTALGASSSNQWKDYSFTTSITVPNGSKIFVRFYPYNTGSSTTGKYFCARNVSVSGTTTTPNITNVTFTTPASCITSQFNISWTGPAGFNAGTQTILAFLKAGTAVNAGTPTWPLANYLTASTAFGTGTGYENDAANAKCIYKGSGTDAFGNHSGLTITGLTGGTTYHILLYVVTGTNSYSAAVVGNGAPLTATGEPFNNLSSGFFRPAPQTTSSIPFSWTPYSSGTAPYPDGYFIQASNTAYPGLPTDFTDPGNQPNLTSGSGYVKATPNSASTYTWNTGLTAGTMYFFRLNTFTNSGACINYKTALPNYTGRTLQIATQPNPVTSPSFSIDGATGVGTISWTAATGYNNTNHTTLVFVKSGSAVATSPYSANQIRNPSPVAGYYTASSVFGSGAPAYTFDAAAFPVYNGDGTSCTITGLTPGNTYHVLILTVMVTANSSLGIGTPQFIESPGGATYSTSVYTTTSTVYGGTYTWNAGNTTGNWATATNWTPNRITPAPSDQLIFNSNENITPAAFASETIGSITVTNNTTLNLIAVSQTLTVVNNNGLLASDIVVNAGSALSISTGMNILLNANTTANISGAFTIGNGCVYNTSAPGAITTVSGTLTNFNSSVTTASGNLVVTSTGIYNHAFNGGTIPAAVWNTGSICRVTGVTSATNFNGHSQVFSRFVWDCNQNVGVNFVLGVNTSVMEATDSFIVYRTGSGRLQLTSSSGQRDYSVGNYIQYSGSVSITEATGAGGQRSLAVNNSFYVSDSLGDSKFFILNDAVNAGAFGRLFVAGNLVMRKISTNTVSLDKVGLANNSAELWFNGGANQFARFSTINGNIDFNTAQATTGFSVTLGSDAIANKFMLTQGTFNIASNTLTINNAVSYPSPGNATIGGSSSSNLTMGFNGNAGTLKFAIGSKVLKNFTQNADNTVTLGTELTITAGVSPGRDSLGLNAVLNTNDSLILRSDIDGTARLARLQVNGSGVAQATINGKVIVERYLPMVNAASARRWRLLTAPFKAGATAPSINEAWQEGVSNADRTTPWLSNPKSGYGTHITRSTTYVPGNGYDHGSTNNPSIYFYDKSVAGSWNAPATTTGVKITDNSGCYMLFARGDRSILVSTPAVAAVPTTLEPKGELNLGRVTIPAAASGDYQTVGNPYASQIKLDNVKFNDTLGISKTIYLWDPKALGSSNVGKFITCSGNGSSYIYTGHSSAYDTKPGVIESSGAFMVKSNGGTIEFNESDKTTESTTIGIASRPARQPVPTGQISTFYTDLISLKSGQSSLADGIAVSFNKNYKNSIDNLDAPKLSAFNTKEDLGIKSSGHILAIERRKEINTGDTVFLTISKLYTAPYQFIFRPVNFDESYAAFIEDNFTGSSSPIDMTNGSSFDFNITTDSASFLTNRFYIVFKRVKKEEEPVITKKGFLVFPNPVQNRQVHLQMNDMPGGEYNFKLINTIGQVVQKGKLIHQADTVSEQINISKSLGKGIYKLQIVSTDKKLSVVSVSVP